jgi:exodeoxyribonuclease VII small subunit
MAPRRRNKIPINPLFHLLVTIRRMPEEQASPLSFEKSLEELERTVKELERGDLPLERSLALFETGMRLSAECKKLLEEAESRVEVLSKRGSEMVATAYKPEKPAK